MDLQEVNKALVELCSFDNYLEQLVLLFVGRIVRLTVVVQKGLYNSGQLQTYTAEKRITVKVQFLFFCCFGVGFCEVVISMCYVIHSSKSGRNLNLDQNKDDHASQIMSPDRAR